jgi:hypothetical protein
MVLACVILTCLKPEYRRRRRLQEKTIDLLIEAGVDVYYLTGDPSLREPRVIVDWPAEDPRVKHLQVPCEDSYDYLSTKMYQAYTYFLGRPEITGILKIDDDVTMTSLRPIKLIQEIGADYMGNHCIPKTANIETLDVHHIGISRIPFLNHMATVLDRDFMFFLGPAYYVSRAAMRHIRRAGLEMYSEDASVGYALTPYVKELKFCEVRWLEDGTFVHPDVNPLKVKHTVTVDGSVPEADYKKIIGRCVEMGWAFVFCAESEVGDFDAVLSRWFRIPYDQKNRDWAQISLGDFLTVGSFAEDLPDILITSTSE